MVNSCHPMPKGIKCASCQFKMCRHARIELSLRYWESTTSFSSMKKNDSTSYLFEIITGIIWIMEMLDINEYMPILTTQIDEMVHIDFLCKNFIVYVFTWCTMFGWWLVSSVIISKSDYCPYITLGSSSLSGIFCFWASRAFRGLYWYRMTVDRWRIWGG